MNLSGHAARPESAKWRVTVRPYENVQEAQARARLANQLRPLISERLRTSPANRRLVVPISPLHEAEIELLSGTPTPEHIGTLDIASPPKNRQDASDIPEVPVDHFPSADVLRLSGELVGLEAIMADIQTDLACRYDGALDEWSRRTGCPVPGALRSLLEGGVALYLLEGAPGTGKTSLARVILDARCRALGVPGQLLTINTRARGNGLVGNFSQNIHDAFEQLRTLPAGMVRGLLIDEVESIAVRRSREQTHIEDIAGCSSLLQALDDLPRDPNLLVFLTTNQASAIDPALRRRCAATFQFGRPSPQARAVLLSQWLPDFRAEAMEAAVRASEGMTPADINASLAGVFRAAIFADESITQRAVLDALTGRQRTEEV